MFAHVFDTCLRQQYRARALIYLQAVSPLLPQVFTLLFGVLTTRRSPKTTVGFITCVARMICMHGAEPILGAMEASQAGSSRAVFTEVIPNNLDKVSSGDDKRVVSIAFTRALCEHDAFLAVRSRLVSWNVYYSVLTWME